MEIRTPSGELLQDMLHAYLLLGVNNPALEIRETPIFGRGIFAKNIIREREFICEYKGDFITSTEGKRREKLYDEQGKGSYMFFFNWQDKNFAIDATNEPPHKHSRFRSTH